MARDLVMAVLAVDVRVVLVNPFKMVVSAEGRVPSGGWSDPQLELRGVSGGVATYEFTAVPPTAASTSVISRIDGLGKYADDPQILTAIRVVSANNEVLVPRQPPQTMTLQAAPQGGVIPWPWRQMVAPSELAAHGNGATWAIAHGLQSIASGGSTWPFGQSPPSLAPCDLRGMFLRVLGPNEVGTKDFNPNRVTIHVDDDRIVTAVTYG